MTAWVFAAEQLDYKVVLAALAVAALAIQVVLQVLKWRKESAAQPEEDKHLVAIQGIAETTQRALEAAQRAHEATQEMRAILIKEHPATQTLRVYTPLRLEDDVKEIRRLVEDVHGMSGVHTDPGVGRKR